VVLRQPSRTRVMYSFSVPAISRSVLVAARLTPITSTPLAQGSRVPAWPTRFSPVSRRTMSTTSCEVIPTSLYIANTPSIRDF
jgi:hypothetical protein